MNTKILEYMIAIAEEKSISQAAERFYLSQPVLSRHLKKIEDELGTPIFRRDSRQMTLTEAGIIFINNAQAILHAEKKMEEKLAQMRLNQKESLTILAEPVYFHFFLKQVLPLFEKICPDFHIILSPASPRQAREALLNRQAAVAVYTAETLQSSDLELLPLFTDELLLVTPRRTAAPKNKTPDLSLLRKATFCLHLPGSSFRHMEDQWLASLGISPKTILETDSFQYALNWVHQEGCCAFIPKERLIRDGSDDLQVYPASPPCRFYQVLAHSNTYFRQPVSKLIHILKEQFASFPDYIMHI